MSPSLGTNWDYSLRRSNRVNILTTIAPSSVEHLGEALKSLNVQTLARPLIEVLVEYLSLYVHEHCAGSECVYIEDFCTIQAFEVRVDFLSSLLHVLEVLGPL